MEEIANEEGLRDSSLKSVEVKPETCPSCKGGMTKVAGKMRLLHHFECPDRKKK